MPEDKKGRTLAVIGGRQGIGEEVWQQAESTGAWRWVIPTSEREMNVLDPERIEDFAQTLWETGHRDLDIIYCAGVNTLGKIGELKHSTVMHHYAVNVAGFIMVLDAFQRTHGGRRVSVTAIVSDSSRVPMRGSVMYASSKAALAHAIRCAARELAPAWRVNGISPGVVANTPMTDYIDAVVPNLRGWTLEEAQAYERSMIPMGRRALKTEVAEAAIWATRGPEFMTGSIIDVAGGK